MTKTLANFMSNVYGQCLSSMKLSGFIFIRPITVIYIIVHPFHPGSTELPEVVADTPAGGAGQLVEYLPDRIALELVLSFQL